MRDGPMIKKKITSLGRTRAGLGKVLAQYAKGSESVAESLRRTFDRTMRLKEPREMHMRMCRSGKTNSVPQRYLLSAPEHGDRLKHGEGHGHSTKHIFETAAKKMGRGSKQDSAKQVEQRQLLQVFAFYAEKSAEERSRSLSKDGFHQFVADCKLVERTDLTQDTISEAWRVFCRGHAKVDFEGFCKGIGLLSQQVYKTAGVAEHVSADWLISQHILPNAQRVRSDPLTLALLWDADVQRKLNEYRWQLWVLFIHFKDLDKNDEAVDGSADEREKGAEAPQWLRFAPADDTMDFQEFYALLRCFRIVGNGPNGLTRNQAQSAFNQANLSEVGDVDVDSLNWSEYVEAICRTALMLYPVVDGDISMVGGASRITFKSPKSTTFAMRDAIRDAFQLPSAPKDSSLRRITKPMRPMQGEQVLTISPHGRSVDGRWPYSPRSMRAPSSPRTISSTPRSPRATTRWIPSQNEVRKCN